MFGFKPKLELNIFLTEQYWSLTPIIFQQSLGLHTPSANARVAAHNRNTEMVYWFACKSPAGPADVTYVEGQGLTGRCR